MVNEAFGWAWFVLGMLSGAALGLGFRREAFMGGYASWRRRLARLGHISFFGLGLINVLFAISAQRLTLGPGWIDTASWALIAGGVTMPLCCGLAAWIPKTRHLFAIPVLTLLLGTTITAIGLLGSEVAS